jgi:molybdate transport system regulatory protein
MRKANALTGNPAVPEMRIQVRVELGAGHRIGPGKVDLLEAIGEMGSITAAGRRLGMSYRRAWLLVSALNQMFDEAVVETVAGGAHGGGARLTAFGERLVSAYRTLEKATGDVASEQLAPFRTKLARPQG